MNRVTLHERIALEYSHVPPGSGMYLAPIMLPEVHRGVSSRLIFLRRQRLGGSPIDRTDI